MTSNGPNIPEMTSNGPETPEMTSNGPDGLIMPAAGRSPIGHGPGNDHVSCKKYVIKHAQEVMMAESCPSLHAAQGS